MVQHLAHFFQNSFSDKYNCEKLIYLEHFTTIEEAINRETQLKRRNRAKKEALINALNPDLKICCRNSIKLIAKGSGDSSTVLRFVALRSISVGMTDYYLT